MSEKENNVVFLYSNQPVSRVGRKYHTQMKNFIDFLATVSVIGKDSRLIVPCKNVESFSDESVEIDLPGSIIEVGHYSSHAGALKTSFINAIKVRRLVKKELRNGHDVVIAGPGPNSFLFWLSLMLPAAVKYVFFIRGDTVKTVKHIYSGKFTYYFAVGAVKLFRNRIRSLLLSGRALVFLYGEKLREQYHGDESLIHVICPLIDDSDVKKYVSLENVKEDAFRVLYVGRLSEEKNILKLIEACALAKANNMPFMLTVVGHGPLGNIIRSKVVSMSLQDEVDVIGYLPYGKDLFSQLNRHDVLCLPSKTEGIPRVIVEALTFGLPVLTTPVGSIPAMFDGQVTYINGFDADNILESINWCRQNHDEIKRLCEIGRQQVDRFSLKTNARIVDDIIGEFLARRLHGQSSCT